MVVHNHEIEEELKEIENNLEGMTVNSICLDFLPTMLVPMEHGMDFWMYSSSALEGQLGSSVLSRAPLLAFILFFFYH